MFQKPYFYFLHGEITSTASQLTSPASQKSKDLNKVLLILQDLGFRRDPYRFLEKQISEAILLGLMYKTINISVYILLVFNCKGEL